MPSPVHTARRVACPGGGLGLVCMSTSDRWSSRWRQRVAVAVVLLAVSVVGRAWPDDDKVRRVAVRRAVATGQTAAVMHPRALHGPVAGVGRPVRSAPVRAGFLRGLGLVKLSSGRLWRCVSTADVVADQQRVRQTAHDDCTEATGVVGRLCVDPIGVSKLHVLERNDRDASICLREHARLVAVVLVHGEVAAHRDEPVGTSHVARCRKRSVVRVAHREQVRTFARGAATWVAAVQKRSKTKTRNRDKCEGWNTYVSFW